MATISAGLADHWRLIGELTGVRGPHEPIEPLKEIRVQAPAGLPLS